MSDEERSVKSDPPSVPVLVITGPVGVGKTSVSMSLSERLSGSGIPHALIDMDWLRWCPPSPKDDPFHVALGMRNLAAVGAAYREAGAERIILADVIETRDQRSDYEAALPGAEIQIVRLKAPVPTIHQRLEGRETGENLEWYLRRATELAEQMDRDRIEDLLIDTEGKTVGEIAQEVMGQAGWELFRPPETARS